MMKVLLLEWSGAEDSICGGQARTTSATFPFEAIRASSVHDQTPATSFTPLTSIPLHLAISESSKTARIPP
jgi:hypothetical protein